MTDKPLYDPMAPTEVAHLLPPAYAAPLLYFAEQERHKRNGTLPWPENLSGIRVPDKSRAAVMGSTAMFSIAYKCPHVAGRGLR